MDSLFGPTKRSLTCPSIVVDVACLAGARREDPTKLHFLGRGNAHLFSLARTSSCFAASRANASSARRASSFR